MSDARLYPYVLEPKVAPAIWGGELWQCWDENRVRNGTLAGKSVGELRATLGAALTGAADPRRLFPILTKIITANDSLSVQVHPDDAYAQRVEHQPNGKTECWYIMSAEPNAELVLGWTRDTSREEYERRVADGTLAELLRRVPVRAGDAFYIPAGNLHSIGGGIVLFETQQASDLTYRIFDWNRLGADGKPRELAVQKAADVLNYHRGTTDAAKTISYTFESLDRAALIADDHFIVERVVARDEPASIATHDAPLIIMPLDGALVLQSSNEEVTLEPHLTALVPAGAQRCSVRAAVGNASAFMLVTTPPSADFLDAQLLAAGIDQDRIKRFLEQF